MKRLFSLAVLLVPLAAHAVVATTSRTGSATLDDAWSGVGSMSGASAVAVGPHLVLTAGHVSAGSFLLDGQTYRMTSTEKAPKIGKKATDLRLVRIEETLPTWYDVASSVKKGAAVTMVGYGDVGIVKENGKGYALTGREGQTSGANKISGKGTMKGSGPALKATLKRAGDAVLASGDSGGGWFVGGELVGISAFVYSDKPKSAPYGFSKTGYFGSGAIDLTNKTLQRWLDGEIAGDASTPALSLSSNVQAVPEPSGLLALGVGAGFLLRRRR